MHVFDAGPLCHAMADARIVGCAIAIAHRGQTIYAGAAGWADRENHIPMAADTPFRLASLTKAVVCVAALSLAETGVIDLEAPVTDWLPWFTPALASGERPPISLRQLMTHTSGLGYGFAQPRGNSCEAAGVSDGLDESAGRTLEDNLRRLATVPLLDPPGTAWRYSLGIDVLGAVLERVTGLPLSAVIARQVTRPLSMNGTMFTAPPGMTLAIAYADGMPVPVRMASAHAVPMGNGAIHFAPARAHDPAAYPSGGTGLIGTAADYLRFLEAVRTGGGGIVTPETAERFTTNMVGDLTVGLPGSGLGWGLGVAIMRDPAATASPLNAGSWSWGGVYGHSYWVDPVADLSVVALTNTAIAGMAGPFPDAIKAAVYAGLPR